MLTIEERRAAEAAFAGRRPDPDWSEQARQIYDGLRRALIAAGKAPAADPEGEGRGRRSGQSAPPGADATIEIGRRGAGGREGAGDTGAAPPGPVRGTMLSLSPPLWEAVLAVLRSLLDGSGPPSILARSADSMPPATLVALMPIGEGHLAVWLLGQDPTGLDWPSNN